MNLIFVIGRNRSGTKWFSNIISENSQVSSIQREGAGGIIECNLLSTYPKNFNLKNLEEKTAFEILFRHDNFHISSGLSDNFLNEIEYSDLYDFFFQYGSKVLEMNQTSFFLQKASTDILPLLIKKFPQAKFVVIQRRNVVDNVVSNILLHTNKINYQKLFRLLLGYWRYRKLENVFIKKCPNIYRTTFENLKADTENTVRNVSDFLEIPFEKKMLAPRFSPNTSYKNQEERKIYITPKTKFWVNLFSFFLKFIPHSFFNQLYRIRLISDQEINKFIAKTFELYRNNKS